MRILRVFEKCQQSNHVDYGTSTANVAFVLRFALCFKVKDPRNFYHEYFLRMFKMKVDFPWTPCVSYKITIHKQEKYI